MWNELLKKANYKYKLNRGLDYFTKLQNEDKADICKSLCDTLRKTAYLSNLEFIKFEIKDGREIVTTEEHLHCGVVKHQIDVTNLTGFSMVREIARRLIKRDE